MGYKTISLRDVCDVEYGKSPNGNRDDIDSGIPIFGTGGKVGWAVKSLFEGPLVVVARKGTLSKPVFYGGKCWIIDTAYAVLPKEGFDAKWLYYNFLNYELEKLNEATGVPSISRDYLYRVRFTNLPYDEQRKIADILTSLDMQIEQTEGIIAKYQQIKQDLMHDLFTRGIDPATGNLRPSPKEAPDMYKKSSLGMIPLEWEVEKIDGITTKVGSGVTPRGGSDVYKSEGVLFIRSQNVHHAGLILDDVAYISPKVHVTMASSTVHPHDVLLNITGASIGRCSYFPTELNEANVNQHVCIIRLASPSHSKAHYFSSLISSHLGQNQIYRLNAGGNREGLNYQQVRVMQFAVSKEDEMTLISQTLLKMENMIKAEIDSLGKLSQLKKGLMSDLLSGKVKVSNGKIY